MLNSLEFGLVFLWFRLSVRSVTCIVFCLKTFSKVGGPVENMSL